MNKIKCKNNIIYYFNYKLTVNKYYEYKDINHRTGKIYIKNDEHVFRYYPISFFEYDIKIIRKNKLENIKNKYK